MEIIELPTSTEKRNVNKVSAKTWKRWSPTSRVVFNSVLKSMSTSQDLFLHPKAKPAANEHWNTVAWNAAWTAADAVKKAEPA